jgi:hypothetical protein
MTGATLVVESPSPPPMDRRMSEEQSVSVYNSNVTRNSMSVVSHKRRLADCGGVFVSPGHHQQEKEEEDREYKHGVAFHMQQQHDGWNDNKYMEQHRVPLVDHTQHHIGGGQQQQQQKRTRLLMSSLSGREASTSSFGNNDSKCRVVHKESVVKALKGLFPTVGDDVIGGVLEECGEDVDGAIRRLHGEVHALDNGNDDSKVDTNKQGEAGDCRSKDEWLDVLVQEMAAAKDVEDAKGRAAKVLDSIIESVGISNSNGMLVKENALLKRAVGIQNSKLHEMNERCREFDSVVGRYQELEKKCHALEMHNYSLQLHLKQATESLQFGATVHHHHPFGGGGGGAPNPDVF